MHQFQHVWLLLTTLIAFNEVEF